MKEGDRVRVISLPESAVYHSLPMTAGEVMKVRGNGWLSVRLDGEPFYISHPAEHFEVISPVPIAPAPVEGTSEPLEPATSTNQLSLF